MALHMEDKYPNYSCVIYRQRQYIENDSQAIVCTQMSLYAFTEMSISYNLFFFFFCLHAHKPAIQFMFSMAFIRYMKYL